MGRGGPRGQDPRPRGRTGRRSSLRHSRTHRIAERGLAPRPRRPAAALCLERRWPHKGWIILKLAGLDDLSAAEAWVGAEVQVPAAERAPAPEGSYFQSDLAGCDVFDRGQKLGVVESVEAVPGAAALLHVRTPQGGEVLVPFAAAFVAEVALAEHRLALTLPEGLVDLNP